MKTEYRGLPICAYIDAGATSELLYRAQARFRPLYFHMAPLIAESFEIKEFRAAHKLPANKTVLHQGKQVIDLSHIGEVPIALDMRCIVTNRTDAALIFYGEIWGDMEIDAGTFNRPVMKGR